MAADLELVVSGKKVNNMGRTCSVMPNGIAMVQQDNLGPEVAYSGTVLAAIAAPLDGKLDDNQYYTA